jgi:methylisocitrate lyase
LDAAVARAKLLEAAGADAIFAEAMASLDEFAAVRKAVDIPILANMTEFGKSELFTVSELEKIGVNIIIYPVSLLRSAMGAAERVLKTLKAEGSLKAEVEAMQTRSRLYELLDYKSYESFDNSVFNFKLNKDQ